MIKALTDEIERYNRLITFVEDQNGDEKVRLQEIARRIHDDLIRASNLISSGQDAHKPLDRIQEKYKEIGIII
jgi:hypothetical protein